MSLTHRDVEAVRVLLEDRFVLPDSPESLPRQWRTEGQLRKAAAHLASRVRVKHPCFPAPAVFETCPLRTP